MVINEREEDEEEMQGSINGQDKGIKYLLRGKLNCLRLSLQVSVRPLTVCVPFIANPICPLFSIALSFLSPATHSPRSHLMLIALTLSLAAAI